MTMNPLSFSLFFSPNHQSSQSLFQRIDLNRQRRLSFYPDFFFPWRSTPTALVSGGYTWYPATLLLSDTTSTGWAPTGGTYTSAYSKHGTTYLTLTAVFCPTVVGGTTYVSPSMESFDTTLLVKAEMQDEMGALATASGTIRIMAVSKATSAVAGVQAVSAQ
ncbi:hypothetical protein JCM8097_004598 [Rhodosporidiobolus ruineniae]